MACTNPRTISYNLNPAQPWFLRAPEHQQITVGCGKCLSCLKKKQTGFAQRVYKAMQHYRFAWFVTLTYRDKNLPVACTLERASFDTVTGEMEWKQAPLSMAEIIHEQVFYKEQESDDIFKAPERKRSFKAKKDYYLVDNSELLLYVRGKLLAQKASSKPRYFTKELDNDFLGWNSYRFVYTFSTSRYDFQSWLKASRVEYERAFGRALPEFKYLCAGEMGPKTCRPHMHCLFLSNSVDFDTALDWILCSWQRRFGFTQKKKIDYVNKDGSRGDIAVAKYISKYITKGKFECDSCKYGYAQKNRLCASKFLGAEDFPGQFKGYYFGFDIYGVYDPNTLRLESTKKRLDMSQILHICDVINRRAVITFSDGKSFPMSQYFRDKLFSYYVVTKENIWKKVRYYVSYLASLRLRDVQDAAFTAELQRACASALDEDSYQASLQAFLAGKQSSIEARELDSQKSLESFYSNSIF